MKKRVINILLSMILILSNGMMVYADEAADDTNTDVVYVEDSAVPSDNDQTEERVIDNEVESDEYGINACAASNPYSGGYSNCTWSAWQLCYEDTGHQLPAWRNAGTWYDSAANAGYTVSTTPRAKSIAVWVDGGAGHVGYVTGVKGDQIYVKEGGYLGAYHEGYVKASGYRNTTQRLLGYIYIPVDVERTDYVNIGDSFRALIIKKDSWKPIAVSGDNVALATEYGMAKEQWNFKRQSDGSYVMTSCYDGRALDVSYSGATNGTNVGVYKYHNSDAQKWYLFYSRGGYMLVPKCAKKLCLDVSNNYNTDGTNVQIWTQADTTAQVFEIYVLSGNEPTSVGVSAKTTTMYIGDTQKLVSTVLPADSVHKGVKWQTSNRSVATVDSSGNVKAVGEGTATISCIANYSDKIKSSVTITVKKSVSTTPIALTSSMVTMKATSETYTGKELKPMVEVKDGSKTLVEGKDYKVTYSNNIKVGTATVRVEGTGKYGGWVEKKFTIMPKVSYRTQVQTYGWEKNYAANGAISGTIGKAKRLETIQIKTEGDADLGITYRTHVQSYGWQKWTSNGTMNGTVGKAKRLEAIQIKLTGDDAEKYSVYYRVHAQSYGWLNWAKDGEYAGTAGLAKRLEAIQIVIVAKDKTPGNVGGIASASKLAYVHNTHSWDKGKITKEPASYTENGVKTYTCTACGATKNTSYAKPYPVDVTYKTQVQSYGWMKPVKNGQIAGTIGQSKRMETMSISVKNLTDANSDLGIAYNAHVQSYGWQGKTNDASTWKKDGQNAGTVGKAKRLEAIQIKLTGEDAEKYDVYYRVHAQSYGWLNWAKNGEISGTAGCAKRLEGIQIIVVEKGAKINTSVGGVKSANSSSYIIK